MENNNIVNNLLQNSRAAMMSAIEIHNKPIFAYRYEVTTILITNAWELALKAFIMLKHNTVKIINDDGSTKPFDECLNFVSGQLGKPFLSAKSNIENVYKYRCDFIHFYGQGIDQLLFSLLAKNVHMYYEFMINNFSIDLAAESNLILLPIGFKKPISPVHFLSKNSTLDNSSQEVIAFINSIVNVTHFLHSEGVEDSILVNYKMNLTNEERVKNADLIAAITKNTSESVASIALTLPSDINITSDDNAKKVKIAEESVFDSIYTEEYDKVAKNARLLFTDFKQNKKFNLIMSKFKNNPTFHKKRLLDPKSPNGVGKDFYTKAVYKELEQSYSIRAVTVE